MGCNSRELSDFCCMGLCYRSYISSAGEVDLVHRPTKYSKVGPQSLRAVPSKDPGAHSQGRRRAQGLLFLYLRATGPAGS
jgi:hypothetical protein